MTDLQEVIVAVWVKLHVKLVDGEGDAAAGRCADVPHTLSILRVFVGVTWAAEHARRPMKLSATTCTTHSTKASVLNLYTKPSRWWTTNFKVKHESSQFILAYHVLS